MGAFTLYAKRGDIERHAQLNLFEHRPTLTERNLQYPEGKNTIFFFCKTFTRYTRCPHGNNKIRLQLAVFTEHTQLCTLSHFTDSLRSAVDLFRV